MDLPTTRYDQVPPKAVPAKAEGVSASETRISKISLYVLLATVFLAPLFFIPSQYAPLDVVKMVVLSLGILISSLLYAIDAFRAKQFTLPTHALGYASLGVIISLILSTLLSSSFEKSFIGQGFELGTASLILLMFLAAFLISRVVVKDREVILKIYTTLLISFVILALFQIARLAFGPSFLSFGNLLTSVTATLIGKWYDFAIFTAVVGMLSLLGLKFLSLRRGLKTTLVVTLIISGLLLFIINSAYIWAAVALVALCIGIYEYSFAAQKGTGLRATFSRISILTLVVVVISLACAWKGDMLAGNFVKSLKAEYGELILPWQLTLDVTSDTLKQAPLFGVGPNRFGMAYTRFKPLEINQTQFWNSEFTNGFGLLPTFVTTQGVIGLIAWAIFLIVFVREGVRALRRSSDPLKRFLMSSSFFAAAFLWLMNIIYVPSHVSVFLTFVFTGIFAALLVSEGNAKEKVVAVATGSRGRLVPIITSVAVILLVVWLGAYAKKTVALTYFQKGIKVLSMNQSADEARSKFMKALTWDHSDVYYQALSEVNILKINSAMQEIQAEAAKNPGTNPDQKKVDEVMTLIADSVKYTKSAEEIDPNNFYNYLAEARISELGTTLKIPNAYENTKNAYTYALNLNPYNPGIYLNLSRLEAGQGNLTGSQQYLGRALQLKQNYTEAVYFLSQLQVANNQLKDAIISTQVAIQLNPQEPLLHFQLGLLEYNDKNYSAAIASFEKAVNLNNQYANARYFLGLSYARMGRNADAIAQFTELAKTNPDNQEVAFILKNLEEGKSPFTDAQPPIDNKPEKRKTLPVTEKTDKTTTTKK